jgi:hypothetical protein
MGSELSRPFRPHMIRNWPPGVSLAESLYPGLRDVVPSGRAGSNIEHRTLTRFGKAAQPARAEITRFLEDSDLQTRRSATNALEKIDSEDAKDGVK